MPLKPELGGFGGYPATLDTELADTQWASSTHMVGPGLTATGRLCTRVPQRRRGLPGKSARSVQSFQVRNARRHRRSPKRQWADEMSYSKDASMYSFRLADKVDKTMGKATLRSQNDLTALLAWA